MFVLHIITLSNVKIYIHLLQSIRTENVLFICLTYITKYLVGQCFLMKWSKWWARRLWCL